MQKIENIFPLLTAPQKVVITMHQKPDADAMGSSLGLLQVLKQIGHDVTVISPTNWAAFLNWMPGCGAVIDYEAKTTEANEIIGGADWIFCLDFNTLVRTRKMEEPIKNAPGVRVLIDHHQQPQTEVFGYGISNTAKSSTAEMVYDFIVQAGYESMINDECAQCLYAGVMTDTGSFRFPSTTASVHRMVAVLKDKGLDHSKVHEALFDNFGENRFRFIGHVLANRLEVYYEYNTAVISVPQSDLFKYDIKTGDTEGLVNYPLSIAGIKLAVIIVDRGEERKLSFRSKGDFDVNTFARKYFNGGGHFNAAGGSSKASFDEVVKQFVAAMKENRARLSTYQF